MAINAEVNGIIYPSDIIKILKNIDAIGKNMMPLSWKNIQRFTTENIYSICYGNGKFIAGDSYGKMGYCRLGIL